MSLSFKTCSHVLLGLGAIALMTSAAVAEPNHDSNTLHKLGKAIQYPVRKDASNVSIDTHRALGHNSVERRHHGRRHHNAVVTPGGHLQQP